MLPDHEHEGEAIAPAVVAGDVAVTLSAGPSVLGFAKQGKLKMISVNSLRRSSLSPELPTIAETVPGYELSAWFGAGTPTGTPFEIIQKLNQEINAGLAEARIKARFAELGAEPMSMTVAEFRKFVAEETERWAKVVRFSGAKAD